MMRSALVSCALVLAVPATARAFCGFYVAGSDQQLVNDATQVVLMRSGTRTVLAMQNNYKGPPDDFAMVVPVPTVLHEGDVKTLPREVFQHVEQMGAPRLVEYWEQDPCVVPIGENGVELRQKGEKFDVPDEEGKDGAFGVKVEAKFAVGEYQIVILSAKDSTGLDAWLRANKYNIPAGAEPLLRPYVEGGSKFFVAKVDVSKVKFENGRAALSPLRFHYDADELSLPVRLGMANSAGTQDLIVNIFSPAQRYKVANYDNVTIPTNLDVTDAVKDRFGAFYAALFDATLAKHPHAVVTEYAWDAMTCDPCPGPVLDASELATLGADVLGGEHDSFVLTRLHARYGKDLTSDLVFDRAPPIVGGREILDSTGRAEQGARADAINNFQARYAIRHPWTGPIRCEHPVRGRWGGPPPDVKVADGHAVKPALDLAYAPRGQFQLATALVREEPELGVRPAAPTPVAPPAPTRKSGCGCNSSDPAGLAIALLAFVRPKRRRARSISA
jgi:hypothetical protein